MRLRRDVHAGVRPAFGLAKELLPDLSVKDSDAAGTFALGFFDNAEREAHWFLLDEKGKAELLRLLTGVEIATSIVDAGPAPGN